MDSMGENINSYSAKKLTEEIMDYAFNLSNTWRVTEERDRLAIISGKAPKDIMLPRITVAATCIFLYNASVLFSDMDTYFGLTYNAPGGCFGKYFADIMQSNSKYKPLHNFIQELYLPTIKKYGDSFPPFKNIISEFIFNPILCIDAMKACAEQDTALRAKFQIDYVKSRIIKPATPEQQTANTRQQEKSKSWLKTFIPGCVFAGIWILCAIGSVMRGTGLFGPHIQGTGLEVFFFNFGSFVGNNFALIIAAILFIISIKKKKSDN